MHRIDLVFSHSHAAGVAVMTRKIVEEEVTAWRTEQRQVPVTRTYTEVVMEDAVVMRTRSVDAPVQRQGLN